jgi:hypothetical protein
MQAAELFEREIKSIKVARRLRVSLKSAYSGTSGGGTAVFRLWPSSPKFP